MSKKIVIFDLDGTLLNTLEDLTDSVNYVLQKYNFPKKSITDVKNFVGNGVLKLIERAIPNGIQNKLFKNCLSDFKKFYSQNMYNKTLPYDGILPMLKALHCKGLKIAVVSNKFDLAVKDLCKNYFGQLIDFAAGEDEKNGINKKPCPDMIFKILKKYSLTSEDALYVGDSEVDIQTAKNANIECLSVTWGFKSKEFLEINGADKIINEPMGILNYIN